MVGLFPLPVVKASSVSSVFCGFTAACPCMDFMDPAWGSMGVSGLSGAVEQSGWAELSAMLQMPHICSGPCGGHLPRVVRVTEELCDYFWFKWPHVANGSCAGKSSAEKVPRMIVSPILPPPSLCPELGLACRSATDVQLPDSHLSPFLVLRAGYFLQPLLSAQCSFFSWA